MKKIFETSDIDLLREKIDKIDEEMMRLNALRISISEDIAKYKKNLGLPIYDSKREEEKKIGRAHV